MTVGFRRSRPKLLQAEGCDAIHHARQNGIEGQRRGARLRRQQPHRARQADRGPVDRAGARGHRPRRQLSRYGRELRDRADRRQGHQGAAARQRRDLHQEPARQRRRPQVRCRHGGLPRCVAQKARYRLCRHLSSARPFAHRLRPGHGRDRAGAAARKGEGQVPPPRRIGDRAARSRAQDAGARGE